MILIGPGALFFLLLLVFKPIRRVLLWVFVVLAIFLVACWNGWIGPPAHAEMSAVVQCRIGSYAEQMPDYVCIAFRRGAAKLTTDPNSMYACAQEAELSITNPSTDPTVISATCNTIWQARMRDRVEEAARRVR